MKPKVLYHASPKRDLKTIKPMAKTIRNKKEGPVVFATLSKKAATKFLVPTDDSWTRSGAFGDVEFKIISDKKRFDNLDHGGSIYILPTDTFSTNPHFGRGTKEWTSEKSVTPIGKEDFESGLNAMLENGVQVYFVDKNTFEKIINSEDHGNSIIRSLKSENEIRVINSIKVPDIHKR